MFEPRRFHPESALPLLAGLAWLWAASDAGLLGFLLWLIPGVLLLGAGVSALLYPGDNRIQQWIALGGVIGVLLMIPAFFAVGFFAGLGLGLLSAASFASAGAISVQEEPHTDEVPDPQPSLRLAAEVAIDDALLATMLFSAPNPLPREAERIEREVRDAVELYRERGWLEKPASYHTAPPALEQVSLARERARGLDYEHLSFESGYAPHPDEPGRERWLARAVNRTGHAWVLRHDAPERPWLICIHGYQMGSPGIDLGAFRAARLHHRLGMNVLLPVLPLHGPRKIGRRSGDGYLVGDFLETIHAEAQAMWDIRRLLSWVRGQGASKVGVYGLSLGGYNTALLASLDDDLACAIPGIPATDFTRSLWRHAPPVHVKWAEHKGLVHDAVSEAMSVVSPLALEPRVHEGGRFIFGGVADRLVPPDQVRDLWRHWGRPPIVWYQGAHVTFPYHPAVEQGIDRTLRENGLIR